MDSVYGNKTFPILSSLISSPELLCWMVGEIIDSNKLPVIYITTIHKFSRPNDSYKVEVKISRIHLEARFIIGISLASALDAQLLTQELPGSI